MGLYNFQERFVSRILDGSKCHTIRAHRRYRAKPGETLYLYKGLRRKGAKLLLKVQCVAVCEITITAGGIRIDGDALSANECELLAKADGFPDGFSEMLVFWDGRLPFDGDIIHWKFPK